MSAIAVFNAFFVDFNQNKFILSSGKQQVIKFADHGSSLKCKLSLAVDGKLILFNEHPIGSYQSFADLYSFKTISSTGFKIRSFSSCISSCSDLNFSNC